MERGLTQKRRGKKIKEDKEQRSETRKRREKK